MPFDAQGSYQNEENFAESGKNFGVNEDPQKMSHHVF